MALPSQSPRSMKMGRAYTYRRKRRNAAPLLMAGAGVAVIVLIGGVYAMVSGDDAPAGTQGEPSPAAKAEQPQPTQTALQTPVNTGLAAMASQRNAAPNGGRAPVELTMGRSTQQPVDPHVASAQNPTSPARDETPVRQVVQGQAEGAVPDKAPPAPVVAPLPDTSGIPADLRSTLAAGRQALNAGDVLKGRELLNAALKDPRTPESERATLRSELSAINEELVFSPRLVPGDAYASTYTIQSGDLLLKIANKQNVGTDWRFIARVNGISDPGRIRVGQKLKLVKGPFHAVVDKGDYRLDLYMGPPESEESWMYVRSFTVGLGEGNSTPTGRFVVRRNSKLINPHWVNPRTGEKFDADDPKNPIGERWIGLEGLGDAAAYNGYGIHGTIDPGSIGQQRSMGCVRLADADVEIVYEVLTEGVSTVEIRP